MKEFEIIEKFFRPLTNDHKAAHRLSDDVAKITPKTGYELVISKDLFCEDVHFLYRDGGFKIAAKLLRSNLSDLAAAGAEPLYYLLGFSKNKSLDEKFLREFARGLRITQDEFGLCLIGGDTVSSEKLFFSITIFGQVKKGEILSRDAAEDGDLIFVSGAIGDAFLGLKLSGLALMKISKKDEAYLLNRHFLPTPRIKLGKFLLSKKLSKCAIDVSDGLLADLNHIALESKLDADLWLDKIPFSRAAKNFLMKNSNFNFLDLLTGGDDYELIFTAKPQNQQKIFTLAKALKLDVSCIGRFKKAAEKKSRITLFDAQNKKIKITKLGYEH